MTSRNGQFERSAFATSMETGLCMATWGGGLSNEAPRQSGRGAVGRLIRLLLLAARPDQVVRAVLALDQAGIDRHRERRIVEGHGHVGPFGLADFLLSTPR